MKDDTISKQKAIEALERIFDRCEEIEADFPDDDPDKTGYKMFPDYFTVWKYLHQSPSAEQRHGKWMEHEWAEEVGGLLISNYECSECHSWERSASNYCPNCGVKMDEVEK